MPTRLAVFAVFKNKQIQQHTVIFDHVHGVFLCVSSNIAFRSGGVPKLERGIQIDETIDERFLFFCGMFFCAASFLFSGMARGRLEHWSVSAIPFARLQHHAKSI